MSTTPVTAPAERPAARSIPARLPPLRWSDPWHWLQRGAADLRRAPGVTLFYGLCFWGMALLIGWVFRARPEYVVTLASGCLLVGPFLAMGLYDTSRRLEAGESPALASSLTAWDRHLGSMGTLLLVLLLLEAIWARASLMVVALSFDGPMALEHGAIGALTRQPNAEFVLAYAAVGGVFAALVYCTTAVSVPMMLDRGVDALTAGITSFRVVCEHLGVMLLWAAVIVALVAVSLWPWGAGLVLVGPWLGYASWHAYRSAVEPVPVERPSGLEDAPAQTPEPPAD